MADGLYDDYVEGCMGAPTHSVVDLDTDTIHCGIVSGSDYTENLTTDQDWADTGYAANTCYNSEATQVMTITIGSPAARTCDSTDDTFIAVAQDAAKIVDAVVMMKTTGVNTTSPLIAFWDTGISVTPNGGDVNVVWNVLGLFKW